MKNKQTSIIRINLAIIALVSALLCIGKANAQSDRTFVATTGTDSTTCGTQTSPCRSFNVALPKTNSGGEVIALDSGIYDNFNVGVHAELPGITVNTTNDDTIVLRNLYLSRRLEGASDGIKITRVGALHLENCVVHGFTTGINFALNDAADVFIQDTTVRNSIADGVTFFTNAGLIKASIDNSHFDHNGTGGAYNGINVLKRSRVTARDSTASGNGSAGFVVSGGDLNLENCEAANNRDGVVTQSDSINMGTATVSNSIVTNNSRYGFYQLGGTLNSLGNNVVRRNGTNILGAINVITGN